MTTEFVYFGAVDMDVDGPVTSLYKISLPLVLPEVVVTNVGDANIGDTMPEFLWNFIFDGSSYFNHDDIWLITSDTVERAMKYGRDIHSLGKPEWFDHGKYSHASINGNWLRQE